MPTLNTPEDLIQEAFVVAERIVLADSHGVGTQMGEQYVALIKETREAMKTGQLKELPRIKERTDELLPPREGKTSHLAQAINMLLQGQAA